MRKIIEKKVNHLVKKYKTSNPFELCDYLKIRIFYENLGENINGFFQSAPKNKIIHINSKLDYNAKCLTCSHELGHALFHYKLNILFLENNTLCVTNKFENEADYFSYRLQIYNMNFNDENLKGMTLEQLSYEFNLPINLLKIGFNID